MISPRLAFLVGLVCPIVNAAASSPNDTYIHPKNGLCTDYTITETVTWSKGIWNLTKPQNNFDIAALRTSLGALDSHVVPFSGFENATDSYELSGTFCEPVVKNGDKHHTVLLATHGGGYDRRYWASSFRPDEYNFVQFALECGYSVFYYDRLGTGKSQIVSGYDVQSGNHIELLAKIAQGLRKGKYATGKAAKKIVLVGHSLGSIFSFGAVTKYPEIAEGLVLTGASLPNSTDVANKFRGLNPTYQNTLLASSVDPPYDRDSAYVSMGDIYAHAGSFFHEPFDIPTIEYAQSITQPTSLLEMLSSGRVSNAPVSYNGSVMITTGEWDMLACGGHCQERFDYGTQNSTFGNARVRKTYIHPGAGHGVNFARGARVFYGEIMGFIGEFV
ncbi:unnamed protein product [Periconia digitata]|uniref:AB hydrolase-1 domain-containing protein n=1 Tax=Periconia digitata TaxID=1303443 RepID=A0A9W4XU41_9PLEO|nr:unnamed protein product [Periconia digitata]